VIDTNVGVVANDRPEEAPEPPHLPESVSACAGFLRDVTRSGSIAVDDSWEIIREYQAKLRSSGQPGTGDAFLKWVLVNQGESKIASGSHVITVSSQPDPGLRTAASAVLAL
jgi:hypothetical protein